MIRDLTLFTYTHSNCKDVWPLYSASLKRHFTNNQHVVITDRNVEELPGVIPIIHSDSDSYWEVICRALDLVKTNHLLYMQEDCILYDRTDFSSLDRYVNVLSRSDMSFVRLIKSGDVSRIRFLDDLYNVSPSSGDLTNPLMCTHFSQLYGKNRNSRRSIKKSNPGPSERVSHTEML